MELQPIPGHPALKMGDVLVIGDLHIGVEAHMGAKGVHLTSRTDDMFDTIVDIAGTDIDHIIMIGDVKDSVPGSTKQEYREIPVFCDRLLEHFSKVSIVRGNHDTSIEEFVPGRVRIHPATGMVIGDVGLAHGHTWPSERVMSQKILVLGHEHPTVMFKDGVGARMSEPCWVRGRFTIPDGERYHVLPEEFIVVPAFNRMLGGSPVNIRKSTLLGPILNSPMVDMDGALIYLLDGIGLGRRDDLMVTDRRYARWNNRENGAGRDEHRYRRRRLSLLSVRRRMGRSLASHPMDEPAFPSGFLPGFAVAVSQGYAVYAFVNLWIYARHPHDLLTFRDFGHAFPPVDPTSSQADVFGRQKHILQSRGTVQDMGLHPLVGQHPDDDGCSVERVSREGGRRTVVKTSGINLHQSFPDFGIGDHHDLDRLAVVSGRRVHPRLYNRLQITVGYRFVGELPAAPPHHNSGECLHGSVSKYG